VTIGGDYFDVLEGARNIPEIDRARAERATRRTG